MTSYDINLSAPAVSADKQRLTAWLGAILSTGLSLLIISGLGVGLAVQGDALPRFDWYLRPAPHHLLIIHYGPAIGNTPKMVVALRTGVAPKRVAHYALSLYLQTPRRAWSWIWLW